MSQPKSISSEYEEKKHEEEEISSNDNNKNDFRKEMVLYEMAQTY